MGVKRTHLVFVLGLDVGIVGVTEGYWLKFIDVSIVFVGDLDNRPALAQKKLYIFHFEF